MTIDRDLIQRLAERLDHLQFYYDLPSQSALLAEAHDYLDQPEPEELTDKELRATLLMAIKNFPPFHPDAKNLGETEYELELQYRKARALIAADRARCGRPAIEAGLKESEKYDEDHWRKDALEKLIYAAQHFRLGVYSAEELEIFENRGRAVLANWGRPAVEPEGPTEEELLRTYGLAKRDHCYEGPIDNWPKRAERAATVHGLRAVLALWGRPATTTETP